MSNQTFKASGRRFRVNAFDKPDGSFCEFVIGEWQSVEARLHLTPEQARELADALNFAAHYAEGPRIGTAADLGCEVLP